MSSMFQPNRISFAGSTFLGLYWPARSAPPAEVSGLLWKSMALLHDKGLSSVDEWIMPGGSLRNAQVLREPALEELLQATSTRVDPRGASAYQLGVGMTLSVWNGNSSRPIKLTVNAGAISPHVQNSFVIDFPDSARGSRNATSEERVSLLADLIEVWSPAYGRWAMTEFAISANGEAITSIFDNMVYRAGVTACELPMDVSRIALGSGCIYWVELDEELTLDERSVAELSRL